jgi:Flp pilus assembly protein TadD
LAGAEGDLGMLLAARGEFEESRRHLERAVATDPNDAFGESNLCFVLTKLGRPNEAITHCDAALRISPGMPNAKNNLNNARAAAALAP